MHVERGTLYMYIDFSNAFDTLDHDKLLQLMWDQGFPSHAVEVVRGLHTGACTTIRTSFGESDSIDIERGSLQGYGLSPFLFLLFIDPLLRWLHQGGRGYRPGCLTDAADAERHACDAPAFADDVAVLAAANTATVCEPGLAHRPAPPGRQGQCLSGLVRHERQPHQVRRHRHATRCRCSGTGARGRPV